MKIINIKYILILFVLFFTLFLNTNVFAANTLDFTCNYNNYSNSYSIPYPTDTEILSIFNDILDSGFIVGYRDSSNPSLYFFYCDSGDDFYYNGSFRCVSGVEPKYLRYYLNDGNWVNGGKYSGFNILDNNTSFKTYMCYLDANIYTGTDMSAFFYQRPVKGEYIFPYIADDDETLIKLNSDYILILPGSLEVVYPITLEIVKHTTDTERDFIYNLELNSSSAYYNEINGEYWYEVPINLFSDLLDKNYNYSYNLCFQNGYDDFVITRTILFTGLSIEEETQGIITENFEKINDKLNQQYQQSTEQFKESQKTQKGIWDTIKEVTSYINPFSENFFVYKLIDLLIDALKSLFIPANDYFSNYFNELMDWFSNKLGFLAYPLELILDILNRFLNINFNEPIISIPDIEEPTTGLKFISATDYDLNSLLKNETLKNVHNIYLIIIDAIIIFGLVNLLKHKMEEVMTK